MTNLGLNTAASVLIAKNPKISDKLKIVKRALKIMLLTVGLGLVCFVLINLFNKSWINVLGKIPAYLKNDTYYACIIMGLFYFLNIPFSLISSLFVGFQKAYIDNLFNILVTMGNFCSLILVVLLKGNLVLFAFFYSLSLFLINVTKYVYFYHFIYKKLNVAEIKEEAAREGEDIQYKHIFYTGMRFFFIGTAAMVVWNTDNFIISNFLGISNVTPYSITFKLYNIIFLFVFMINSSVMPIMAREFGQNNWEWINKIYSSFLTLAAIIGGLPGLAG